jgi:beta-N-acetylhexosaminidase
MIWSQLMIAFDGRDLPADIAKQISERPFAGVTLFYGHNVDSPAQVRALTAALQAAATQDGRPLLIAIDQEGGQLNALGMQSTQFAGAMALGAVASEELAERVGQAIARELRAVGVNVNYSPVCDLATNPKNPALGIRSFGDDPVAVGKLAAATVRGLQAEGVAATLKHFPGHGDIGVDTHLQLAVVDEPREAFLAREVVPFRLAMDEGPHLVMAGHVGLPALTGDATLPASLARPVMTHLLRDELGYDGLAITDALDMHALAQGAAQIVDAIAALNAGEDLLLGTADAELLKRLEEGLAQAELRGLLDPRARQSSFARLVATRTWLAGFEQPPLDVVGSAEHQQLATELAQRSMTLVRNDDGLLPLRLADGARVAVIQPRPTDMTPADTSSHVPALLAEAVRRRHSMTDELVVEHSPTDADIAALAARVAGYEMVVLGTTSANLVPAQAALAQRVGGLGVPTVTVALRTPWDLAAYPAARTHACSYGILPPTIDALAAALFGEQPFSGHLPVEIAGLYPRGHGLT